MDVIKRILTLLPQIPTLVPIIDVCGSFGAYSTTVNLLIVMLMKLKDCFIHIWTICSSKIFISDMYTEWAMRSMFIGKPAPVLQCFFEFEIIYYLGALTDACNLF